MPTINGSKTSAIDAVYASTIAVQAVTDLIPDAGQMTSIAQETTLDAVMDEVEIVEEHDHNITHVAGLRAPQTATLWADFGTLTPYQLTSGNADWGAWIQIFGADDTPVIAGKTHYDAHEVEYTAASEAELYRVQFAYGATSAADALTADQIINTSVAPPTALGPGAGGAPVDTTQMRLVAGTKMWARCKAATNEATLDLLIELHEYPSGP